MENNTEIEYPYPYSLRVIGYAAEDFEQTVMNIFDRHATHIERSESRQRHSREGRYVSLRVQFTLESRAQLQAIYMDLKNSEQVVLVL